MSDVERKKVLVGLETELRRSGNALAVAQADYEKAYTALHDYMNANSGGPQRMLVFSPDVTVH